MIKYEITIDPLNGNAQLVSDKLPGMADGLAFDSQGNLFTVFFSPSKHKLLKIDPNTGTYANYLDIAVNGYGNLFFGGLATRPGDGAFFATWWDEQEILKLAQDEKWYVDTNTNAMLSGVSFQPVPIPGAAILLGSGLVALVAVRRRRQ